jgi:hypothetical protein
MKPTLDRQNIMSSPSCPPEIAVSSSRGLKHQMQGFLEAKYDWLSRTRLSRLFRAGLTSETHPGTIPQENSNPSTV